MLHTTIHALNFISIWTTTSLGLQYTGIFNLLLLQLSFANSAFISTTTAIRDGGIGVVPCLAVGVLVCTLLPKIMLVLWARQLHGHILPTNKLLPQPFPARLGWMGQCYIVTGRWARYYLRYCEVSLEVLELLNEKQWTTAEAEGLLVLFNYCILKHHLHSLKHSSLFKCVSIST